MIGHDFGSPVAGWCALVRPDVFRSVVLMSAPFGGPPALPFDTAGSAAARRRRRPATLRHGLGESAPPAPAPPTGAALAALPRPRKHYQWYYSTREADGDMRNCPQGVHAFLRAYYHHKSADWPATGRIRCAAGPAAELAKLPTYYVMDRGETMPETVAPDMPTAAQIAACRWLTDDELRVYSSEYARTGFQGGLQWYRCGGPRRSFVSELQLYAGRSHRRAVLLHRRQQRLGRLPETRRASSGCSTTACTRHARRHLVDGAGHWVQQEQPEAVVSLLQRFLSRAG